MNYIPQNCLDKFENSFKNFPSLVEFKTNKEGIEKLTKNKTVLWSYKKITDESIDIIDDKKLIEIDGNGIYVYTEKQNDDVFLVYFLFLQNHLSNVNFIISKLIKNNNNGIKQ